MTRKEFMLRLPPDLADQIDERRALAGISRNEWITRALTYALSVKGATITTTTKVSL